MLSSWSLEVLDNDTCKDRLSPRHRVSESHLLYFHTHDDQPPGYPVLPGAGDGARGAGTSVAIVARLVCLVALLLVTPAGARGEESPAPGSGTWRSSGDPSASVVGVSQPLPDADRAALRASDRTPPEIRHETPAAVPAGTPLQFVAQVSDPSGVAAVWVRLRSGKGDPPVTRSLSLGGDGRYRLTVPTLEGASALGYILGARDYQGNSAEVGSDALPLSVPFLDSTDATVAPVESRPPPATGIDRRLLFGAGLLAFLWIHRRARAAGDARPAAKPAKNVGKVKPSKAASAGVATTDEVYWRRLMWPLLSLPPDEVIDALRQRSLTLLHHPTLGPTRFPLSYLIRRYNHAREAHGLGPLFVGEGAGVAASPAPGSPQVPLVPPPLACGPPAPPAPPARARLPQLTEITAAFRRLRFDDRFNDPVRAAAEVGTDLGVKVRSRAVSDPAANEPVGAARR